MRTAVSFRARAASAVRRRAMPKKDTKGDEETKAQLRKTADVQGTGETDQVSSKSGSFSGLVSNGMKCTSSSTKPGLQEANNEFFCTKRY